MIQYTKTDACKPYSGYVVHHQGIRAGYVWRVPRKGWIAHNPRTAEVFREHFPTRDDAAAVLLTTIDYPKPAESILAKYVR